MPDNREKSAPHCVMGPVPRQRSMAWAEVISDPLRLTAMMLLALALAACGHRPDVMRPVTASTPGTDQVDMLVATTRQPSKNPSLRYTGERGEDVRLDNIVVSIPPAGARKIGQVQWPNIDKPDPSRTFVTTRATSISDKQVMPWFRKTSSGKKRVLVFVHGFNNDYADAVYRFAQLVHDAHITVAPVLFTWPSRGNVLDYVYDRESTIYSRFGLGEVLKAAVDSPDVDNVTVLAHSMGTSLAMEALRDMANRTGRVSPKIKTVILASPDIDIDVFKRQVVEMGPKRPHITILSAQDDLALKVSTWVAGDVQRLGATDFRPYEKLLAENGISVVDASGAKQEDLLGHSAFAQNEDILHALGNTFLTRPAVAKAALLPLNALRTFDVLGVMR